MENNNNNNTTLKFIEASRKERFAFKQFCDRYNLFKTEDHFLYLTPEDGYDKYDCLVQEYEPNEKYTIKKRMIMEFKIRQVSDNCLRECREDGWIFEYKKFKALEDIRSIDPNYNECYYISFLPDKTVVWNITDLNKKGLLKWISKEMNKATMNSTTDKKNKKVCLLKEEWGKSYQYTFDEQSYKIHNTEKERLKQVRKKETKKIGKTMTDFLFGNENDNE